MELIERNFLKNDILSELRYSVLAEVFRISMLIF